MIYEGKKFLLKIYRELYNGKKYLIDKDEKDNSLIYLKNRYYEKYLIKRKEVGTRKEDLKKDLKIYSGNIDLSEYEEIPKEIKIPEIILGFLDCTNLTTAKGLENLRYVQEIAFFDNLTTAEGLENLKYIGWGAFFHNLTTVKGLENLEYIGGNVDFHNLTTAKGLENIQIDGLLDCSDKVREELEALKSINDQKRKK